MTKIFTIGHSRHDIETFVGLLQRHGIQALADVRRKPWSGRNPQFNRDRLAKSLGAQGIAYRHFEALGGHREAHGRPDNAALRSAFLRAYADHALTPEFAVAFGDVRNMAQDRRVAVMCAEANWRDCHRQILADYLLANGLAVRHIGPDGALADGSLAPAARVESPQRVLYPAPAPRQRALDL